MPKSLLEQTRETISEIEELISHADSDRQKDEIRAIILCFHDRYGANAVLNNSQLCQIPGIASDCKKVQTILKKSKKWTLELRQKLALRTDIERIQMQRPLHGESLLALVVPKSSKFGPALNSLLVLAFHWQLGINDLKHNQEQFMAVPFKLPGKLQPKIPNISKARSIDAVGINSLIKDIYLARTKKTPLHFPNCTEFVERLKLTNDAQWNKIGTLPEVYSTQCEFTCIVPQVIVGKQVILWKTWHTTTGNAEQSNVTAFVDYVPKSYLTDSEYLWYEYCVFNAPFDPGAGSSRGSWQMLVAAIQNGTNLGLPKEYCDKWTRMSKAASLNDAQKRQFYEDGYLILDIPEPLQTACPPKESLQNFNIFFQTISRDYTFDCCKIQSLRRSEKLEEAEKYGNKYQYYTDKIDFDNPFEVNASSGKSTFALKGGKLITADSGMGPGTTLTNEANHLQFQFSDFVTDIMASFYGNQPMLCILERFRMKTSNQWKAGCHVDVSAQELLPKIIP